MNATEILSKGFVKKGQILLMLTIYKLTVVRIEFLYYFLFCLFVCLLLFYLFLTAYNIIATIRAR